VTSTHPQADGFAGDQVLLAPAYTSTDAELAEMVDASRRTMTDVERRVSAALAGSRRERPSGGRGVRPPRDPRHERVDARQGLATGRVRVALEHGTVMTDLHHRARSGRRADRGLRALRAPRGSARPDRAPDPDTLHDLRWRPGGACACATPSWPDGSPAFASREVLRRVLDDIDGLGFEVMAAIEYEIRIWDEEGAPASSGISYSLNEIGRYGRFLDELVPALEGLGIELSAVHTEAGPGLLELNVEARRGLAAADDAALLKFGGETGRGVDGLAGELPREDEPRRGGLERPRASVAVEGRDQRVRRRGRVGRAEAPVLVRGRRRDRAPAGGIAPAQPDDQLVQAPGSRLVRSDQRHLGLREPVVCRPRDPLRAPGAVAVRMPPTGRRREPVPGARCDRGVRGGRDPA
jgi:hypothetical protein